MKGIVSRSIKMTAAVLLVLAMAWQHVQATRLGYEVENSRKRTLSLKGRLAVLQMDLQRSVSPARLSLQARTRLGMFPVSPESLRVIGTTEGAVQRETFLARLLSRLATAS